MGSPVSPHTTQAEQTGEIERDEEGKIGFRSQPGNRVGGWLGLICRNKYNHALISNPTQTLAHFCVFTSIYLVGVGQMKYCLSNWENN